MLKNFPATALVAAGLALGAGDGLGASTAADWLTYNGDYAATRFSTLTEITPGNIARIKEVCSYPLPEKTELQSGLVAVDGLLFFTTAQHTYAIDATTCRLRWQARHEVAGTAAVRG